MYCIHDCSTKDISKPRPYVNYPCHMLFKTLIKHDLSPQKFTCITSNLRLCQVFLLIYSSKLQSLAMIYFREFDEKKALRLYSKLFCFLVF